MSLGQDLPKPDILDLSYRQKLAVYLLFQDRMHVMANRSYLVVTRHLDGPP